MEENPKVTVLTITRGRPEVLLRAIESVWNQTYLGVVEHAVTVDDCNRTAHALERAELPSSVRWSVQRRAAGEADGPARLAVLRNRAVEQARSSLVAFLDDDNEYLPDHLQSLVAERRSSGARAVHSHRLLFHADGRPYREPRMPWTRDPDEGRQVYRRLVERGVFVPDSNLVRDRVDGLDVPDRVQMVDTSEWLFERALLQALPFPEQYSLLDWENVIPEDNKLLSELARSGVHISCTGRATLKYYLGGYSNNFSAQSEVFWDAP